MNVHTDMEWYLTVSLTYPQIAWDCNHNVQRAENELKLYSITMRFPSDDVVCHCYDYVSIIKVECVGGGVPVLEC